MSNGVNPADLNLQGSVYNTPEGGVAVKVINKTGASSVKGHLVSVHASTAFAVTKTAVDATTVLAVMYSNGVADGGEVWVVMEGAADIAFHDNVGVKGNYVRAPAAGDAAIAVAEQYTFTVTHAATAAGDLIIKIPSLAAKPIALVGTEDEDAVATAIAAAVYTGWTDVANLHVVTFTQSAGATTDGDASYTPNGTGVTITIANVAVGKPAITPTDGVAVATGTIPGAGKKIGFLLEDHTARRYADDLATARCLITRN
jgi:hypothetical protein